MCWSPRAARAVPGASCLFSPPMMATLPLAALGASLGLWAYGTYEPNSPLFGRVIGRGPGAGRVAYLTFDDGPNPGATRSEERRVGKECRCGWRPHRYHKKRGREDEQARRAIVAVGR